MTYNTDINIIGSIPDYHLIYTAIPLLIEDKDKLEKLLVSNNEFNFRTEKSRKRFFSALNSAFISNNDSINLLSAKAIEYLQNDETAQALILFWLFSINNKLFYEINRDVYLNYYYQGRAQLQREDIIAYLKDLINRNSELKGKWSEKTIGTIASKYLTILKKLNLLDGSQKKKFRFIRISDELLALFIYLYLLLVDRKSNILEDEFLLFSFVSNDTILERLKKLSKKDLIKMNFSGTSLNVEASFTLNEIVNGIFR